MHVKNVNKRMYLTEVYADNKKTHSYKYGNITFNHIFTCRLAFLIIYIPNFHLINTNISLIKIGFYKIEKTFYEIKMLNQFYFMKINFLKNYCTELYAIN